MNSNKGFTLAKGVQVRNEVFGLLFYDYRGPRLYFVPSKDLLKDTFFNGKQTINEVADTLSFSAAKPRKWIMDQIKQVLKMLEAKGLVNGQ
jgi:putative mycofactocin binding protein MftB